MRQLFRITSVVLLIASIWTVLNLPEVTNSALLHFYYIPICLSAWFWGYRGGIVAGVLSGLISGPLMWDTSGLQPVHTPSNWILRTGFFTVIGLMQGILIVSLRRSQAKIVEQNEEICQQKFANERIGTEIIQSIAQAIEVRDHYTSGHCYRVAYMAVELGKRLGLTPQELMHLRWAGIVHDVGKIGIPEEILNKPGKLTDEEYEIMKRHPHLGAKILSSTRYSADIIAGVRHHHERMDGKGYPDGISGEQIPLQARILAVCDVWDALTSDRSYRRSFSFNSALDIMRDGRGTQFDSAVLDHFMELVERDFASGTAKFLLRA